MNDNLENHIAKAKAKHGPEWSEQFEREYREFFTSVFAPPAAPDAQGEKDAEIARLQAELESTKKELAGVKNWVDQLEHYAGSQMLRSDFQTADDMRAAYNKFRADLATLRESIKQRDEVIGELKAALEGCGHSSNCHKEVWAQPHRRCTCGRDAALARANAFEAKGDR